MSIAKIAKYPLTQPHYLQDVYLLHNLPAVGLLPSANAFALIDHGMTSQTIDFGPGERHVFKRTLGKTYYVPELFHLSPFYDGVTRLLINDIHQSRKLLDIYGAIALQEHMGHCIMINNHPIRRVAVFGRVLSILDNSVGTAYTIRLDDSSGNKLYIDCIVSLQLALQSTLPLLNAYPSALIVQVWGVAVEKFGQWRIEADYVQVECRSSRLAFATETELWREYLNYRHRLAEAWVYEPASEDDIIVESVTYINVQSIESVVCKVLWWILDQDSPKFRLAALFIDPHIDELLCNHVLHNPAFHTKAGLFQCIRRHLQDECRLIVVTKNKNVYCKTLLRATEVVSDCMEAVALGRSAHLDAIEVSAKIESLTSAVANVSYVNTMMRWLTRDAHGWSYDEATRHWLHTAAK